MNKDIDRILNLISESRYFEQIILTAVFVLAALLIRKILLIRIDKRDDLKKKEKFNLKNKTNHFMSLIAIVGISIVWFSIIQTALVSMLAVAAAIVIATKELIMCFTGGILVSLNKHFRIGDRIEVNGIRGYVIYKSMTVVKVLEIGPEKQSQQTTGHVVTIPNSIFLTESVENKSYFKGYSISSFVFKVKDGQNSDELERFLLEKATEICGNYLVEAKKQITQYCDKEGLDIPAIEPKTKLSFNDNHELMIILKMPVKNSEIANIDQSLIRSYLNF